MANVSQCNLFGATKKLVTMFNAVPVVCRTSTDYYNGPNYFEINVDIHRFSYTVKMTLSGFDKTTAVYDTGFVIQGESENELPECILGCVRASKPEVSQAVEPPDSFLDE